MNAINTLPGFDAIARSPQLRPWHYLTICRVEPEYLTDDYDAPLPPPEFYAAGADDAPDRLVADAKGDENQGVWDNWAGVWVVEPDWADQVDIKAEGWTRRDLIPASVAAGEEP